MHSPRLFGAAVGFLKFTEGKKIDVSFNSSSSTKSKAVFVQLVSGKTSKKQQRSIELVCSICYDK